MDISSDVGGLYAPLKKPKSEPALELHIRAAPSVEAHHYSVGPATGRNLAGRQMIKKNYFFEEHLKKCCRSFCCLRRGV